MDFDFLATNYVNVLPWPSHSPDLTPIEYILDFLNRKVRARDPPLPPQYNTRAETGASRGTEQHSFGDCQPFNQLNASNDPNSHCCLR